MTERITTRKSRLYQTAVTIAGSCLWLTAIASTAVNQTAQEHLSLLILVPLLAVVCLFQITFPLPSGLRFTEKLNFSLGDSLVLLVACWYGIMPAIFIAGIEGYVSSRRAVRRVSSNLFSIGMMSLVGAGASVSLYGVMRYGFGEASAIQSSVFPAVATAILVASIVHIILNCGLLSTLLALRHGNPLIRNFREILMWALPMFLPTSAVASLMYLALQYTLWMPIVIGGPILIAIYLGHRHYRNGVQERINLIERSQQERIVVMEKAHRETIEALAVTINAKDEVTHEHVQRVQIYATGVARLLGCTIEESDALKAGALLHDIGKIGVPDTVLNKPGKLTPEEFDQMKLHTIIGAKILGRVEFPYPIVPIVRSHHERWDGRGYPDGLSGEEIPLTARILSVVDCFDAVREDRPYRKAMTREQAVELLMQGSGTQYDPRVVGSFVTHLPEFEAEIRALRDVPVPVFHIEPAEALSEAARGVAPAAGLAENAPTSKEFSFTQQQSNVLFALSQEINKPNFYGEAFELFAEKLRSIVPFDLCAVTLATSCEGDFVMSHAVGEQAEIVRERKVVSGEGVTGWVLANSTPLYNTDPQLDFPSINAERFSSFRTIAAVPIVRGGDLHGAVTFYSSVLSEFTADHRRLLEEAAKLLGETSSPSLTPDGNLLPSHYATAESHVLLTPDIMH